MVDFSLRPERTALINVDVQCCFVEGTPLAASGALELVGRINRLASECRAAGVLVVHTRGWVRADGSNRGVAGEIVPELAALYTEGAPTSELHPSLHVEASDIILDKPRYGAFHATDLELILRGRNVDTVIISGIATNVCCETTAREAAQRDFHVLFLSDGTATMAMSGLSAEQLQAATCASMSTVFGQVATIDEVIRKIAGHLSSAGSAPAPEARA